MAAPGCGRAAGGSPASSRSAAGRPHGRVGTLAARRQRAPAPGGSKASMIVRTIRHGARAIRNAFFSPGHRLFGLSFSRDYLRFAWRARQMQEAGPGSLDVAGFRVAYPNQAYALFLLHEIFVNAE